jgi:hypothetical protein
VSKIGGAPSSLCDDGAKNVGACSRVCLPIVTKIVTWYGHTIDRRLAEIRFGESLRDIPVAASLYGLG